MLKLRQIFFSVLALLILTGARVSAQDKYAYSILKDGTLTLYFDSNKPQDALGLGRASWQNVATSVNKVVIDKSFSGYSPKSCAKWFMGLENVTEISGLENLNTSQVTDMMQMFAYCKKLKSIDVGGFNTENVTDMQWMFSGCEKLKTLDLSSFNTEKVEDFSSMFSNCYLLETIYADPNKWSTKNLKYSEYMFSSCFLLYGGKGTVCDGNVDKENTKYAVIDADGTPGYLTAKGTKQPSLKIEIPYRIEKDDYALGEKLVLDGWFNVTLPSGKIQKLRLSNIPLECFSEYDITTAGKKEITLTCFGGQTTFTVKYSDKDMPYTLFDTKTGTLTFYYGKYKDGACGGFSTGTADRKKIVTAVFEASMSDYILPYADALKKFFDGCENMTSVIGLENLNISKVKVVWGMFRNCKKLTKIDLSGLNMENVMDFGSLFDGCALLKEIKFGNSLILNTENMMDMFQGCEKLESIDLSRFCTAQVRSTSGMFEGCKSLKTLDLSMFDMGASYDIQQMFNDCVNLTTIYVSDFWVIEEGQKEKDFFRNCTKLTGGNGTKFDAQKALAKYGVIDKAGQPGYMTYKKAATVLTAPSAKESLVYTGKEQTLVNSAGSNFGKPVYSLDGKTYSEDLPKAVNAGEYTVWCKIDGTDNYTGVEPVSVKVTVNKAQNEIKTDPSGVKNLRANGKPLALTTAGISAFGKVLYSLDGTTYSEDIPTAAEAGEYTVYYKAEETDNFTGSEAVTITVTVNAATPVNELSGLNSSVKVWSYGKTIFIEASERTSYRILDLNGRVIKSGVAESGREEVILSRSIGSVLIVETKGKTFKIMY
ncbi:MAG: BspA family leucine-rich repeat surface protein [Bacteroidales bacterium]|nr:BspA family leucine-rich repeat surface protein [Bacteroidales bacterium]